MPQGTSKERKEPSLKIKEVGKNLMFARKSKNWTRKNLADQIGVSQDVIFDYEKGRSTLSGEMVIKVCTALNISADVLLGLDKDLDIPGIKSKRAKNVLSKLEQMPPESQESVLTSIELLIRGMENS